MHNAPRSHIDMTQIVIAATIGALLFAAVTWVTLYHPSAALANRIGIAIGAGIFGGVVRLFLSSLWRRQPN
jgi:hypothetical protein